MATDHSKIIGSEPIHPTRQRIISPMNSVREVYENFTKVSYELFRPLIIEKRKGPCESV